MFKKLKSLGGGSKGRQKFRLDVTVTEVEGLPEGVTQCRVVWARQAKVSVTNAVAVSRGHAAFNEELSQIATLTRDSRGVFDSKEYHIKLQAPERGNQQKYVTLGKAVLDMARFVGESPGRPKSLKLSIQLAQHKTAVLSVVVASAPVKGMGDDDDTMSVVTGVSGLSGIEQDLSGFDNDSRRGSTGVGTPLRTVTEETDTSDPHNAQKVLEERDVVVRQLESELAAAKDRLAAAEVTHSNGTANAGPALATLSEENTRLKQEMEQLQARHAVSSGEHLQSARVQQQLESSQLHNRELQDQVQALKAETLAATTVVGSTAAAVAGKSRDTATADQLKSAQERVAELEAQLTVQLENSDSTVISSADNIQKLQRELQGSQATIAALQHELAVVKSSAQPSQQNSTAEAGAAAAGGVSPELTAKLALYETKIEELMHLVEEQGPQSDREAELEARLKDAEERLAAYEAGGLEAADAAVRHRLLSTEQELAEAENMATEALNLLEAAQAENAQLHDQLNQLRMDMDWQQKKAAKEKADWEARMQGGFRRVEESVVLAERLQKDKDEMQARYDKLLAERDALEAQLDPHAVGEQVQAEVERAKLAAEQQARIEVESLQHRIKEMEEFVEKADAARLEMAAKVSDLAAQLAAVKREEQDSFDQVKSAEERADGLMLELQYLQHEKERLQGELTLAREHQERAAADLSREAGACGARATELESQLDEAKSQLRLLEQDRGELHNKQLLLEEELESTRLQLATAAATAGVAGAAAAAGNTSGDQLLRALEERKRAAEDRTAQLEATSRELSQVRANLQQSQAECGALRTAVQEAEREAAGMQSRVQLLEEAARAREVQTAQMEQLQRDMAAAMLAAKEHNNNAASLGQSKSVLEARLAEAQAAHLAEVASLTQQLDEAHQLADYSSKELAGVVQQLAAAEAERKELGDKVSELRDDLGRLRKGDDGELRTRIEKLEKELLVTRNARDVNALFKVEHDRIATELIETKLLWAEAQEQIVKLKQSLVKSQEKTMSFASKLTRLETKFYKKLQGKSKEEKERKKQEKKARAASGTESSN